MKEKANAWGNAQDRDSRFVPEQNASCSTWGDPKTALAQQQQTSFGSYTKLKTIKEIEQA
jgi:hypothetical protein